MREKLAFAIRDWQTQMQSKPVGQARCRNVTVRPYVCVCRSLSVSVWLFFLVNHLEAAYYSKWTRRNATARKDSQVARVLRLPAQVS